MRMFEFGVGGVLVLSVAFLFGMEVASAEEGERSLIPQETNTEVPPLTRAKLVERAGKLEALTRATQDAGGGAAPESGGDAGEAWSLEARFELRKAMLSVATVKDPGERRRLYSEIRRLNAALLADLKIAESNQTRALEKQ